MPAAWITHEVIALGVTVIAWVVVLKLLICPED